MESEDRISAEDLEDNIDELVRICHEKFLFGMDKNFDYKTIDEDQTLDDLKYREKNYFK